MYSEMQGWFNSQESMESFHHTNRKQKHKEKSMTLSVDVEKHLTKLDIHS